MSHFIAAVFSRTPEEVDERMEPYNECVGADSPYSEFCPDDEYDYDETAGQKGHWINRNGRWDWWEIGGRWSGALKLKAGKSGLIYTDDRSAPSGNGWCDQAYAADCDFEMDQERYDSAVRFWEVVVEGQPVREGESIFSHLNGKYYRERYRDKESYAQERGKCVPYAFVAADGSWHEAGKMGWFGVDNSTAESREQHQMEWDAAVREAVEQNLVVTIVDCHT